MSLNVTTVCTILKYTQLHEYIIDVLISFDIITSSEVLTI